MSVQKSLDLLNCEWWYIGMKSVNQIAREIELSPQAIYKRLKSYPELIEELGSHVTFKGGMKFDSEGELAVKSLFLGKDVPSLNQVDNQVLNRVDNVVNLVELVDKQVDLIDPLLDQLYNENAFLREQLAISESRNHELALCLAELAKNNQSLIAMLENKKASSEANQAEKLHQRFLKRFFERIIK